MRIGGASVLFVANAASAAMGFAILGLLTRALDPASFGTLSTLVTLMDTGVMVVDILVVTGMVQVAARLMDRDPKGADMALKLGFFIRLPLLALIMVAGLAFGPAISQHLFGTSDWA